LQGKPKNSEKTCPSATFVPLQIPHDQVQFRTPDRSGGKSATNRLSYGAATILRLLPKLIESLQVFVLPVGHICEVHR
jgi:hypothetical protein